MDAIVLPEGSLELLSRAEVKQLRGAGGGRLHELWRRCSLAVLKSGAAQDDVRKIMRSHEDFNISIVEREGGIALEVRNAPAEAFVDGRMIRGTRDHLFSVLRDLLYTSQSMESPVGASLPTSAWCTESVFHILRNAAVLLPRVDRGFVVCWGGHAITRTEYDFTKTVGYEFGLRGLDVCTGCGAGAMKGPMKGAALGHAKQRLHTGRYLGLTEPSIIAAESPNPIVNKLVILPDMEKRLEAFVRLAQAVVVFPGGAGTAEEILYLLGILLDADNRSVRLPLFLAGPTSSAAYFDRLHSFVGQTLGPDAQSRYRVILGDPGRVAREVAAGLETVRHARLRTGDANFFNWQLGIGEDFQQPFAATHESMAALQLDRNQDTASLAVNLRRAFSGIVGGNVREAGIQLVEKHGPFELHGEPDIMVALDQLLSDFVAQGRMRLSDPSNYTPCFRVVA